MQNRKKMRKQYKIGLILIITVMKSQLQRILKSDLSQYKIAVSQHISNLDQFEECLTERSNFMMNFNEMLKQQLNRITKQPPSQFDHIQLPQTFRQRQIQIFDNVGHTVNSMVRQTEQSKFEYKSTDEHINKQILQKCQQIISKFQKVNQQNVKGLCQFAKKLKIYLKQEIQITKRKIVYDFNNNIDSIVDLSSKRYINRINDLQTQIQKLKQQNNSTLKNQYKKQYEFCIKQKMAELEQRCKQNKQNKQQTIIKANKIQNEYQVPYFNYSPILNINNTQPSQKCQLSAEFKPYNVSYEFTNKHSISSEFKISHNQSKMKTLQTQSQTSEMTVTNNKEASWKHFVCDLQSTSLKQIKINQRPKQGKQNVITTIGSTQYTDQRHHKNTENKAHEPNLPILLRKNISDKSYDIPNVRSIIVSYPPVEEGFSTLKLGNQVIYKGMWKSRKFHGKGKLTLPEFTYEGQFQQGLFHGRGTLKIGCLQFIGQFCQNKAEGEGKLKIGAKQVTGYWRNNLMIERY